MLNHFVPCSPKSLEEGASHILPGTAGRKGQEEREYDILSCGPFCHQLISSPRGLQNPRLDSRRVHGSGLFDGNEANTVTLKQLKGWRRVLVLQRYKKAAFDTFSNPASDIRLPPETHRIVGTGDQNYYNGAATARSARDHSRWGKTPARLRFSTPHWESQTTVEQAKMQRWMPRLSTDEKRPSGLVALPTRSMDLTLDPARRRGHRTERMPPAAQRKDHGQEYLEQRAEVEALRTALDTSYRTLEAFCRSHAKPEVTWPLYHRWGSLQVISVG